MQFDRGRRAFEFTFRHDAQVTAPTEFFIPAFQYPRGYAVAASDGSFEAVAETQTLIYRHTLARETHTVRVRPGR